MSPVELSTFPGDWVDSLGNTVLVTEGPSGIQVKLAKPDGSGKVINLSIKQTGATSYKCGHYSLDESESSQIKIVWRDKRFADRVTIWTRVNAAAPSNLLPSNASCTLPTSSLSWPGSNAPSSIPLGQPGVNQFGQTLQASSRSGTASTAPVGVPTLVKSEAPEDSDWSHVLTVLASGPESNVSGIDAAGAPHMPAAHIANDTFNECGPNFTGSSGSMNADDAARWSEVLDLLAAAPPSAQVDGGKTSGPDPAGVGQVDLLFSAFQTPGSAPAVVQPIAQGEERAREIQDILARLLREKASGTPAQVGEAVPFSNSSSSASTSGPGGMNFIGAAASNNMAWDAGNAGGHDDWKQAMLDAGYGIVKPVGTAVLKKTEGPIDRFIRIFQLDQLAAKCLHALQDDEIAHVIESCQGRLKWAANPSATVMIAIKNVAQHVGRRYWGNKHFGTSELARLIAQSESAYKQPQGELTFIMGSPEPDEPPELEAVDDPYGGVEQEPANKKRKTELEAASPEPVGSPEDDDMLFFEDTAGGI